MKNLFALVMVALLSFSLVGCASKQKPKPDMQRDPYIWGVTTGD